MRTSLQTRQYGTLVVASFFAAVFLITSVVTLGSAVQTYKASRAGVDPGLAWQIVIAPGSIDATELNREIRQILMGSDHLVVCVEEYGPMVGAPALVVFDNRSKADPLFGVSGRWFSEAEMRSEESFLIVREDSYLVQHPNLAGDTLILPHGTVIGRIPSSLSGQFHFITTISSYTPAVLPTVIYLQSDDTVRGDILRLLDPHTDVVVTPPESLRQFIASYMYTLPLVAALCVVCLIASMIAADWVVRTRSRWRIERLVGATRMLAALRTCVRCARSSFGGSATAVIAWMIFVLVTDIFQPGLLPATWWIAAAMAGLLLPGLVCGLVAFAGSVSRTLHYREWAK